VAQHYGLDPARTLRTLFPESRGQPLTKALARAWS